MQVDYSRCKAGPCVVNEAKPVPGYMQLTESMAMGYAYLLRCRGIRALAISKVRGKGNRAKVTTGWAVMVHPVDMAMAQFELGRRDK